MTPIRAYIDAAKTRAGVGSDRQLGFLLGLSASAVCAWQRGRSWPDDETMVRLAALAGVAADEALLDLNIWRAKEPARAVYLGMLKRHALGLLALAIIWPLFGANAGELTANRPTALVPTYTLCAIRRLLTRLGNLSFIRPAQA